MPTALAVAAALGGPRRRTGRGMLVRCPAHADRSPSLHLSNASDGRLLWKCFAGCPQDAVRDALAARGLIGDIPRAAPIWWAPLPPPSDRRNRAIALAIWRESVPAGGTPVEVYLRSRGVTLELPPSLRFHASLRHGPSDTRWPAMVAAVQSPDGRFTAIHRTFLRPVGSGKALVEMPKMSLGPTSGGAVRLAPVQGELHVGEGIETALAAAQATGQPTWAALSSSGLRTLPLPPEVREVVILADGDDAGEKAAEDAARRWFTEGRRVRIARAPNGLDFNDLLASRGEPKAEAA